MRTVRWFRLLLPLVACSLGARPVASGQAASGQQPTAQPAPALEITVGHSVVPLFGPWRFAPGDSPLVDGALLWADPGFDDTGWSSMDLHPSASQTDPSYGAGGYLTGWSARGFPKLAGFAWYRLRVHVASAPEPLSIKMSDHVDDSYEVYANGKLVGHLGDFSPDYVGNYRTRPLVFALPAPDVNGDIELAIRFYMEPNILVGGNTPNAGGMHQPPLLGLHSDVDYIRAQEVRGRVLAEISGVFVAFLMIIAAAGAFWIWLLDRGSVTYLWLALALLLEYAGTPFLLAALFSETLYQGTAIFIIHISSAMALICWILFWRDWFQLPRDRRTGIPIAVIATTLLITEALVRFVNFHVSIHTVLWFLQLRAACNVALVLALFLTLFQGARKDRTGALMALPPIALLTVSQFTTELLVWLHFRTNFFPFGLQIAAKDIASVLMVLVVGALVTRRFIGSQVAQRLRRQAIDQDLEQASELQLRVLIPEPIKSSIFAVETAYYPARTVGGDFFQIIPRADGSLLIVVGDVSGKGISAAMLVAVMVGAIRTRADETFDPAAILRTLNDRLLGRAGSHFATCIVAHLTPSGFMVIANAGHIPAYLNGAPLDLPGSLPLGILYGEEYEVHTVELEADARLTFFTDGVPEARNAAGVLLGFDPLNHLSTLDPEAIARVAMIHGQDDDITIVSVSLLASRQLIGAMIA
jgi:hypothetical protein